jgi:Putative Ig domain
MQVMVLVGGLTLAACGGGGGGGSSATGVTSGAAPGSAGASTGDADLRSRPNQPPAISGAPTTVVGVGVDYVFQPVATDPDGDALRFVASNLPAWATLDPTTGRIQGQPKSSDDGVSGPITLSVSDGVALASLPEFRIQVQAGQGNGLIKLAWQLPVENADGTAVAKSLGTRIYYGRRARAYDANVTVPGRGTTRHVLTGLQAGTWYVALTTVDPEGIESDLSEERAALVN